MTASGLYIQLPPRDFLIGMSKAVGMSLHHPTSYSERFLLSTLRFDNTGGSSS
jgi:hypothetical protein